MGNWVQPVLSIPGNLIQIGVAAVIVLPVAAVLKKALRKEVCFGKMKKNYDTRANTGP